MRANDVVSMDINELRGWAAFMDRAVIASLVATVLSVSALGVTTWLSFRFGGEVRAQEQAALDRYKGIEGRSAQVEQDVTRARERAAALEQEIAAARARSATLEQQVTAAREQAALREQEAAAARDRAEAFGQAARDANERAARADRETADAAAAATAAAAAAAAKQQALQLDAEEIRKRLAALGQQVRQAAQGAERAEQADPPAPTVPPAVAALRKHAGTPAAVFILDGVSDAPAAGAAVARLLGEANWAPQTWKWTGVDGIFGVVVLVREGSGRAIDEAASVLVEQLRAGGFNATKGDWPADWRRYRGTLDGPQAPAPTDAPIRIVIGIKPR